MGSTIFVGSTQKKKIFLGLESILYPNQISSTLLHESRHAAHDSKSLFSLFVNDSKKEDTAYPKFHIDEIFAHERDIRQLKIRNHNVQAQMVGGKGPLGPKVLFQKLSIMNDLSERILKKKGSLLKIVDQLRKFEENTAAENWLSTLDSIDPELSFYRTIINPPTMKMVPDFVQDKEGFLKSLTDSYKKEFIKSARYTEEHILKALEIAEKTISKNAREKMNR